jgi:very-short-patch-repair endonuclease
MEHRATIETYLYVNVGQTARDIADALDLDKQDCLAVLRELQEEHEAYQDASYRWWLGEPPATEDITAGTVSTISRDILGCIARYYLECVANDDQNRVSTYASSRYQLEYVELPSFPHAEELWRGYASVQEVRELLTRKRKHKRLQPILGYPTYVKHIRSKKGWEGYIIEPVFYYRLADDGSATDGTFRIAPTLNSQAVGDLSRASGRELLEQTISTAEELGLHDDEFYGELDEVLERLQQRHPTWPWKEQLVPSSTSEEIALSDLTEEGIYNRCVVMTVEGSNITKGLESELGSLAQKNLKDTRSTALGTWLEARSSEREDKFGPLLEIVPLNAEQSAAVRAGLSQDLTVITGPPGTGKSQVVLSLLLNAAWNGMTALFASRNNKAVEVVETRLNALSSRPALLRLGRGSIQANLSDHLTSLLSATASNEDYKQFETADKQYKKLKASYRQADSSVRSAVRLRNKVDELEQIIRELEAQHGAEVLEFRPQFNIGEIGEALDVLSSALLGADRQTQSFLQRLFWPMIRRARFSKVLSRAETLRAVANEMQVQMPDEEPSQISMPSWAEWGESLSRHLERARQVIEYFDALHSLRSTGDITEQYHEQKQISDQLAEQAQQMWQLWLRIQPSRLKPQERQTLQEYSTIVQMRVDAESGQRRLSGQYYRRFQLLFPLVMQSLPCWAITSLSARGRLPMHPGMFDLLIIDEASQCDIASALPLLYRAKRVVIIGDPMQLRHVTSLPQPKDQQLLARHGLVEGHLGWSYSINSLFDIASGLCTSNNLIDLRDHHRSHAEIIGFSNREFYEGRLRVATKYDQLRPISPDEPAVRWVHIQGTTERPNSGSAINRKEAERVVQELRSLVQERRYSGTVGVVSPFRAQANLVREIVEQDADLARLLQQHEFESNTVHAFQGDERDVMIFSPVVSVGTDPRTEGFLSSTSNLFNVAITRARSALIVVGDRDYAAKCDAKYLGRFAQYATALESAATRQSETSRELGMDYHESDAEVWKSEWEDHLRAALEDAGLSPEAQLRVDKYVLDLALVHEDRKLDIEVDGERYHRAWDGEHIRTDQLRNLRMFELGWDVMRFWVYQVRDDLDWCVEQVIEWTEKDKGIIREEIR